MKRKFEYSKHIMLWKHMAKEEVIEHTVAKIKDDMAINKNSTNYHECTNFNIVKEKESYIYNVFNQYVLNGCYACEANTPSCADCPIKIGRCYDGLYTKYINAIAKYAETDNKEYLNEAIQCASDIAHAELNKDVIEYYDIEVV